MQILSRLVLVLIIAGCTTLYRPEPSQLIDQSETERVYPLIVVPGVMGSQLVLAETGETIWPPGFWSLLFGNWVDQVLRLVGLIDSDQDDGLIAGGLLVEAAGEDFYQTLLKTLAGAGYTCVSPEQIRPDTDCVLFAWDWQGDLVKAAARLDRLIERIRKLRGDSSLKVDIVAHSAGGMVARYFVRFGDRDVLDLDPERIEVDRSGASKVRKLALIGTPNYYGSIFGLQRLMRGYQSGLISIPPELMAIMPSVYQLLPHPNCTWMIDRYGKRLDRDLYDPHIWRTYGESIFNPQVRRRIRSRFSAPEEAQAYLAGLEGFFARALRRGKRFHQALSIPVRDMPNEYLVLGSDCFPTPAVCLLEKVNGEPMIRLRPDQVINRIAGIDYGQLMLEPGDGRVTRPSLLARDTLDPEHYDAGFFPINYLVFACEQHAELAADFTIRHNLLNFLLY